MQITDISSSEIKNLNITGFQAVEGREKCEIFIEGHLNVLRDFGVKEITSVNETWQNNPNSYVIMVEKPDENKYVAGSRIEIYGGKHPLPMEVAIGEIDSGIFDLIKGYAEHGTGEICGLWSSTKLAGNGIASMLIKSSVVLTNILKLNSIFALCSPFTVSMFSKAGFEIVTSIGNNGTFYYPKLDLIATVMILKDPSILSKASEEIKEKIFNIVQYPVQSINETGAKNEIEVKYNLSLTKTV